MNGVKSTGDSKRIGWIDLAKGFCIVLVVLSHVSNFVEVDYPLSVQARAFRMPLYFILSGLFFKQYEGFVGFLKRKVNKLVIPFVFFLLVTSVLPYWFLIRHEWAQLYWFAFKSFLVNRVIMFNEPIWFLLCLFEVNILFYILQSLAARLCARHHAWLLLGLSLVLGYVGLSLGIAQVRLPLYLDTTLSALPFFAFGWWLFRRTDFLTMPVNMKRDLAIVLLCMAVLGLLAVPAKWINNEFTIDSLWSVYPCGVAGTMMVLLVSKIIKRVPVLSFWGRYSIIILCTHYPVMSLLHAILGNRMQPGYPFFLMVLVVTLLVCHVMIHFMRRYMPHVTAQKDVIKVP